MQWLRGNLLVKLSKSHGLAGLRIGRLLAALGLVPRPPGGHGLPDCLGMTVDKPERDLALPGADAAVQA